MGWASTDDVEAVTGQTVTDAQLALAAATIETHSGRPYTDDIAGVTGSRDTHWLKRAEVFQAVWLLAQPDLLQRLNVETVPGEGGTTQLTSDALTLAPYAARALAKLSWKRSRSVRVHPTMRGSSAPTTVNDNHDGWLPLRARI
jgi:hypothetical protein